MSNAALTVRPVLALGEVEQSKLSAVSGWQKLAGNQGQKTDPWPGLLTGKAESEAEVGDEATDADALNEASLFPLPFFSRVQTPILLSTLLAFLCLFDNKSLSLFPFVFPFSIPSSDPSSVPFLLPYLCFSTHLSMVSLC